MSDGSKTKSEVEDSNPYAVPGSVALVDAVPVEHAESTRLRYLPHEASVQALGTIFALGAILIVVLTLIGYMPPASGPAGIPFTLLAFIIAVSMGVIATGLRRLQPWVRIPAVSVGLIGLPVFPIGTVVGVFVIYLICSPRGLVVFSRRYQRAIAQTPHLRYRTTPFVRVFLVFAGLFFVMATLIGIFG